MSKIDDDDLDEGAMGALSAIARGLRKDGWMVADSENIHALRRLRERGLVDLIPSMKGGSLARPTREGLEQLARGAKKAEAKQDSLDIGLYAGGYGFAVAP